MQKDKKKKKTVPFYIVLIILVILALIGWILYETIRSKQSNPTLTTSFGYKFY
jgi:hypothetical protein